MGNSEVGHLNLGAGAVVMQDLTRIDEAVAAGELASNEVLRAAFTGAERVHLIGLVSDGGVHSGFGHLEALIRAGGVDSGSPISFCTRSPTAATRCPVGRRLSGDRRRGGWTTPAPAGSARSSAATGRWTATGAGIGSSAPTTCSSTAAPSTAPRRARRRRATPTSAARPTSSSRRCWWGSRGADPARRLGVRVQLPPRPDARDHARAGRAGVLRGRPRRRSGRRALRDDDRVRGGLAVSGGVRAGAPAMTLPHVSGRPRGPPAARRRDREVRRT